MEYKKYLFAAVLISLLITVYAQFPVIKNKYILYSIDIPSRLEFIHHMRDESLLNDKISRFYPIYPHNSLGAVYLYYYLSYILSLERSFLVVSFFLSLITGIYLFKLGKTISNYRIGLILSTLGLLQFWSVDYFKGVERGFGLTLAIIFLYYFIKKDCPKMVLCIVGQTLFYPPVMMLSLLSWLIYFINNKKTQKSVFFFVIAVLISALIITPQILSAKFDVISYEKAKSMPEFDIKGLCPVFSDSVIKGLLMLGHDFSIGLNIYDPYQGYRFKFNGLSYLLILSVLFLVFLKKKSLELPRELWYFALSSIFLYVLSAIFIFRLPLYAPSRYLSYGLHVVLVMFVAVNLSRVAKKINREYMDETIIMLFLVLSIIIYIPGIRGYPHNCDYPELYQFLSKLPNDVLITGNPSEPTPLICIPFYAKRSVLVNKEMSTSHFPQLYSLVRERMFDTLDAYYSNSSKNILNYCSKYGITHIIIDKSFNTTSGFLSEPFLSYLKEKTKGKKFFLESLSKEHYIFSKGDIAVVPCNESLLK